ncbi:MAG: STAS domain-containing protein [Candidatus Sulfotelmatobacter sp.]
MSTVPIDRKNLVLPSLLSKNQEEIASEWWHEMTKSTRRSDLIRESELRTQCSEFLRLLNHGLEVAGTDFRSGGWDGVRAMLANISGTRAQQGFSASETAMFVFSAKKPLFAHIRRAYKDDAEGFANEIWITTELLDAMGLYTTEFYQKMREEVIRRQQEELLELSTPVVKLWDGILALPLIGTLDSARTQIVMESLLQAIVQTNSKFAIIDITGVPTVDTVVAQHLLKTVTAARLMGADCIVSGVRPQIAQTIVHLGINLLDITTKATLAAAFRLALDRTGYTFVQDSRKG